MRISRDIVEYVAHLSRIELNKQEMEKLSVQLTGILDFIDKLKAVDIDKVDPTSHILPVKNVLREDEISVSLTNDETLKNAPAKQGNFFVVHRVIE